MCQRKVFIAGKELEEHYDNHIDPVVLKEAAEVMRPLVQRTKPTWVHNIPRFLENLWYAVPNPVVRFKGAAEWMKYWTTAGWGGEFKTFGYFRAAVLEWKGAPPPTFDEEKKKEKVLGIDSSTYPYAYPSSPSSEDLNLSDEDRAQSHWEKVLTKLQAQVARPIFDTWLQGTKGLGYDEEGRLGVRVAAEVAVDWLERRLYQTLVQAAGGREILLVAR